MNRKFGLRMGVKICFALLLGASFTASARATEVFRCNNQFSDLPCANTTSATQVEDTRSRAQQRQSQETTQHHLVAAQSLQGQRLRDEGAVRDAQRLASLAPPPPSVQTKAPTPVLRPRKHHGPNTPHFTARSADAASQSSKKK